MARFESIKLRPVVAFSVIILVVTLVVGFRIQHLLNKPQVFFLANDSNGKWIRHFIPFGLPSDRYFEPIRTTFRCDFELANSVPNAQLVLQAFRQCDVWIDSSPDTSKPLYSSSDDLSEWKQRHQIRVPRTLDRGRHQIWVQVTNRGAHPCLLAFSQELPLATGIQWETSLNRRKWQPAVLADDSAKEIGAQIKHLGYPSVFKAFQSLWLWLAAIFGTTFIASLWTNRDKQYLEEGLKWGFSPRQLKWLLLLAWTTMALNNILRITPNWGFDIDAHLEYVKFIAENWRLPLATDGWQTFQSPLNYLLVTPFYVLFSGLWGPESCVKLLRFLPLLCGLAQIELCYRVAKTIFPGKEDLQKIATVVGGLMPMNVYMSQSFCNEPLAGCFTSLLVYFCISMLMDPARERNVLFFAVLGVVWGLALLSKVTPILMSPLIVATILIYGIGSEGSFRLFRVRLGTTLLACFVVSGWYFARNWIWIGKPFVGGWDPAIGVQWWQDPSYRTFKQLFSFGTSLSQPVYAGVIGFWDAIYSSMWADGFLSGQLLNPVNEIPWNLSWMEVGSFMSILPLCCIFLSVATFWKTELQSARRGLLFAMAAIGIYFAAVMDLYLQVPIYSTAKASYMLGLLPCFAVLAAAGAAPLLHSRLTRSVFFALLTCWGTASYVAYFCLS